MRVKRTVDATTQAVTYAEEETSFFDDVMDAVIAPLGVLSSDEETFYSKRTMGLSSAGWAAAGYALGARKPDLIPVIGVQ